MMVEKKVVGEGLMSVKIRCLPLLFGKGHPEGACLRDAKGFTLLEVLIALVILTVGILGAASMQINSIRGNAAANRMTEASIVASDRAEFLLNLDFDSTSLVDGTDTVDGYGVTWVVVNTGRTDTRDITVTASWTADGSNHSFDYQVLKVKGM